MQVSTLNDDSEASTIADQSWRTVPQRTNSSHPYHASANLPRAILLQISSGTTTRGLKAQILDILASFDAAFESSRRVTTLDADELTVCAYTKPLQRLERIDLTLLKRGSGLRVDKHSNPDLEVHKPKEDVNRWWVGFVGHSNHFSQQIFVNLTNCAFSVRFACPLTQPNTEEGFPH